MESLFLTAIPFALRFLRTREIFDLRLVAKGCTFREYNYLAQLCLQCHKVKHISDTLMGQAKLYPRSFCVSWNGNGKDMFELLQRPLILYNIGKLRCDLKHCDRADIPEEIFEYATEVELKHANYKKVSSFLSAKISRLSITESGRWRLSDLPNLVELKLVGRNLHILGYIDLPSLKKLDMTFNYPPSSLLTKRCTNLEELSLNCWHEDFGEGFNELPVSLKNLRINMQFHYNIHKLQHLTNLEKLQIQHDGAHHMDISAIKYMTKLKFLVVNFVDDISPLECCKQLEELTIIDGGLAALPELPATLRKLCIDINEWNDRSELESLDGLKNCTELRELSIKFADVNDISVLAHCQQLEKLEAEGVTVENISCLRNCTKLRYLSISLGTHDIKALTYTTDLEELHLKLSEPVTFEQLRRLPRLDRISIKFREY